MNHKKYLVARKKCKGITFCCKKDNVGEFLPWFGLLQDTLCSFNDDGTVRFIETYHHGQP